MMIDLVYLWVDASDPKWLERKMVATGDFREGSETDSRARWESNDELKYSLRSMERYAPWVRKVFIVTDAQTPDWLDTSNPRVQVVDHTEILPPEALPTYNSRVIESHIYKIPGLAEHFLYANDDMFFNGDVEPGFFFAQDGYPIVRLKHKPLGKWHYFVKFLRGKRPGSYRTNVHKAALMVQKKFGKYYGSLPHHNIDAYKKSDFADVIEKTFADEARQATMHRTRTMNDLQRSVVLYYALAIGHAHVKFVGNDESMRIPVQRADYAKYLRTRQPKLLCLNDTQRATEANRAQIKPFLEQLFPAPSAFER